MAAVIGIVGGVLPNLTALAGPHVAEIYVKQEASSQEKLVYVTGSHLPQRVRVWETGVDTAWPVRIIGPHEIALNNRGETASLFKTEPAVRIIGH